MNESVAVRLMQADDIEAFLAYQRVMKARSGLEEPHHGPYSRDAPLPENLGETVRTRIATPVGTVGWRRYWVAVERDAVVGVSQVGGAALEASGHRVQLGMGVHPGYRRQGIGRALLRTTVAWCKAEPSVVWIDLGVFGGNDAARALYDDEGFEVIGLTRDRFRVDGISIDDLNMTLRVG